MDMIVKIKEYFSRYDDAFDTESIVLLRSDGISLYSRLNQNKLDASTIGALSSGLWQAARALGSHHVNNKASEFRLSFDTSGSGVYILPIATGSDELYLCALYENLVNPAMFKRNLQLIAQGLEEILKKQTIIKKIPKEREDFLFENISDEEMDVLFKF